MTTCRSMTSFASAGLESNVIVCFRVEVFVELVDVVPITVALCVVQAHDLPLSLVLLVLALLHLVLLACYLNCLYLLRFWLSSLRRLRIYRRCAFVGRFLLCRSSNGRL